MERARPSLQPGFILIIREVQSSESGRAGEIVVDVQGEGVLYQALYQALDTNPPADSLSPGDTLTVKHMHPNGYTSTERVTAEGLGGGGCHYDLFDYRPQQD